ncbi:MAG: ornithine carbamoyltransferase [Sulfobacillus benefaciens]|uniref:Ornithine carbamoyltransferase n=1 Tax=Sulfobacillus benefaciens TaxID=453960 RepID=A0A2T2XCM2_9FIRM|nr:MAG: ornithine carbamoyltransferase [Sulfobacillus benefaciens]
MVERMTAELPALKGRSVVSLMEWTPEEIRQLLKTAQWMKANRKVADTAELLSGKHVALLFELPSTRTRVSFQVAIGQLGAEMVWMDWGSTQLGRGESLEDTARVLSRYVDGIVVRAKKHETVQVLRRFTTIPVFNALTDRAHPFQVLADALTIAEEFGGWSDIKLAYLGDGNNMAHSYLVIGAKLGMHVSIAAPKGFEPAHEVVEWARNESAMTGGSVTVTNDPEQAVFGADVLATDVFVSMGDEGDLDRKREVMQKFQVNQQLMGLAKSQAIFLHCLPAHRGEEVTAEVIDGPQSKVWDQAENRLWVQKSTLAHVLAD